MLFLSTVEGLGNVQTDRLLETHLSAEAVFCAKESELWQTPMVRGEVIAEIIRRRKEYRPEEEYGKLAQRGISYMSRRHPEFPEKLNRIGNPPNGIFYLGRMPEKKRPAIAVVGSRACSNYGRDMAVRISRSLAAAGVDIISGMAMGVDGYAHRGALEGGGNTYAVLGCGVDICYPASNRDIYGKIPEQGGILSEYMPGTKGLAVNFPRRNRIISALSDGILVVEAREKSGTWITVDMGLEQGKTIYAVPGRIGDPLSFGCNRLIRQGARLIMGAEDILAELVSEYGYLVNRPGCGDNAGKPEGAFSTAEKLILKQLNTTPVSIALISDISGLSAAETMAGLTMLEIKGYAEKTGDGMYIKRII